MTENPKENMTSKPTLLALGCALALAAPGLHAATPALAAIVQERDAVLVKIVADVESRFSTGTADFEAVYAARLALHTFRRDTAPSADGKLKEQTQVVALHEKRLAALKAKAQAGIADSLEVLRATDALLASQQQLEELQPQGK